MPSLDRTITERLERAAVSTDPDIAALGLAALHYARGNTHDTRRFLLERAGSLDIFERAVRTRWKLLLAFMADRDRERGEFADAITGYRKALELDSTDAGVLLNLGIALAASGDGAAAEVTYTQSLRADSMNALTWVNLGIARAARGMDGPAIAAYQRAMRVDPFDALPWFNLGNIHLRANRFEDALAAYDSAATRSPGMAPAWFNLARAAIPLGRLEYARAALRNGLAFDSADQSARQALGGIDSLLARSGGR
jgi:tetratricopeptide (TPR) repeat protein